MSVQVAARFRAHCRNWLLAGSEDGLLRVLFAGMLAGTATVLALDYQELAARASDRLLAPPASRTLPAGPLPSVRPERDGGAPAQREFRGEQLQAPMTLDLVGGGRLMAVGTIHPGMAEAFAAEVAKRGGYVKTVVLHSPGGSVPDAMAMGRLIRSRGFATEVDSHGYCASSCPLVLAGGIERRIGRTASVGVHQVTTLARDGSRAPESPGAVQRISAEVQRYLGEMDVDPQVWVHAMETPADRLYYFKPEELLALKLSTPTGRKTAIAR